MTGNDTSPDDQSVRRPEARPDDGQQWATSDPDERGPSGDPLGRLFTWLVAGVIAVGSMFAFVIILVAVFRVLGLPGEVVPGWVVGVASWVVAGVVFWLVLRKGRLTVAALRRRLPRGTGPREMPRYARLGVAVLGVLAVAYVLYLVLVGDT
jgi:hypothetical protein